MLESFTSVLLKRAGRISDHLIPSLVSNSRCPRQTTHFVFPHNPVFRDTSGPWSKMLQHIHNPQQNACLRYLRTSCYLSQDNTNCGMPFPPPTLVSPLPLPPVPGNAHFSGLRTCWIGIWAVLRDSVRGGGNFVLYFCKPQSFSSPEFAVRRDNTASEQMAWRLPLLVLPKCQRSYP